MSHICDLEFQPADDEKINLNKKKEVVGKSW